MTTSSSEHHDVRPVARPTSSLLAYGVAGYAGVMLALVSTFQVLEGVAAIRKDTIYVTGTDYTFELSISTWGWIHLILGIVGILVGIGIITGQAWALFAGLVMAVASALSSFAVLPLFPAWAFVILAFDALVIWALSTELARAGKPFA